jgi:hypothetical protein
VPRGWASPPTCSYGVVLQVARAPEAFLSVEHSEWLQTLVFPGPSTISYVSSRGASWALEFSRHMCSLKTWVWRQGRAGGDLAGRRQE